MCLVHVVTAPAFVRCAVCGDTFEAPRWLKAVEVMRTIERRIGGAVRVHKVRVVAISCAGVIVHHCEERPPCDHSFQFTNDLTAFGSGADRAFCVYCGELER